MDSKVAVNLPADLIEDINANLAARGAGTPGLKADPDGLIEHVMRQWLDAARQPAQPEADPGTEGAEAENPETEGAEEAEAPEAEDPEHAGPETKAEEPGPANPVAVSIDASLTRCWAADAAAHGPWSTVDKWADAFEAVTKARAAAQSHIKVGGKRIPVARRLTDVLSRVPTPENAAARAEDSAKHDRNRKARKAKRAAERAAEAAATSKSRKPKAVKSTSSKPVAGKPVKPASSKPDKAKTRKPRRP